MGDSGRKKKLKDEGLSKNDIAGNFRDADLL
jgi:hypothetical protein